jgi:hypothetical protein
VFMRRVLWSGSFSAHPGRSTLARSSVNGAKENHESTNPCQPLHIRSLPRGNRGLRFPGGTRLGYALVVESFYRRSLIEQYLGGYAQEKLGIAVHNLPALGRENPADSSEHFNMACLAIRGSGAANGVSRLHGKVSRRLFRPLFPRWPEDDMRRRLAGLWVMARRRSGLGRCRSGSLVRSA